MIRQLLDTAYDKAQNLARSTIEFELDQLKRVTDFSTDRLTQDISKPEKMLHRGIIRGNFVLYCVLSQQLNLINE